MPLIDFTFLENRVNSLSHYLTVGWFENTLTWSGTVEGSDLDVTVRNESHSVLRHFNQKSGVQ